ncbi:MAG: radical SAM protein, partial [Planctomycetia bacterium]|nr:radical SAM protein [Planctomycetia bacterium]
MKCPKQAEIESRHIISKSNLGGPSWTVNPYIGCLHGCVYCYACFMRRFTGHLADQWGEFVDIKTNAAELFPGDFRRVKAGDSMFFGSVTDAYQPLEKEWELTRGMLKFLTQEATRQGTRLDQISITILTKSDLVLRDLDLLKQIPNIQVGFSIALPNEKARRIFEPCASPIQQRFAALDKLHREGIQTFVFMGPILPHITPIE